MECSIVKRTGTTEKWLQRSIQSLLDEYPFLDDFFSAQGLPVPEYPGKLLSDYLQNRDVMEDKGIDIPGFIRNMEEYIQQMMLFLGADEQQVRSVAILPGTDKAGNPESFSKLKMHPGDVICIVGPTGSGKSRLLADIEWVAQGDTPTRRRILINDETPDTKWRFSASDKLVAQLSQNMNFVMDLTVLEFLNLHAESRLVENQDEIVQNIIRQANHLAGEPFDPETPITSLSGGQSRALMIADTAILSRSPIVLIDEIENAGIDRKKALELLLSEEKIVFMATHDPVLALMGDVRIVIRNGGIAKVIETSEAERSILTELELMDRKLNNLRTRLRNGESLSDSGAQQ